MRIDSAFTGSNRFIGGFVNEDKESDLEIEERWRSKLNSGDFGTGSNKLKPHEKLYTKTALEFFTKKFKVRGKIQLRHKYNKGTIGDVRLNDATVNKGKFIVFFDKEQSMKYSLIAIFHELIHVRQISSGDLLPAPDYKSIHWKGEEFITVIEYNKAMKDGIKRGNVDVYNNLPWEKEAISQSKSLTEEFLKSSEWKLLMKPRIVLTQIRINLNGFKLHQKCTTTENNLSNWFLAKRLFSIMVPIKILKPLI